MFNHTRHNRPVRVILVCCGLILGLCPPSVLAGEGFPTLPTDQPSQAALEAAFDQAAADFGVPAEILKAVAFVESRWVQAGPTIDGGWGIMHLVDNNYCHTLQDGAARGGWLLGRSETIRAPFVKVQVVCRAMLRHRRCALDHPPSVVSSPGFAALRHPTNSP